MISPGVSRFKAEIQFNAEALANRYIDDDPSNLSAMRSSFLKAAEQDDPRFRREIHRYSRMLLLTLALEVDRIENDIRRKYPEFQYIDLEVL